MQNARSRTQSARITLIFALVIATMIFGCNPNQINQNLSRTCYKGNCLDYSTWGQKIDSTINQQAVGYAYIIINNGLQETSNAFGKARTSSDAPETAMTLDLRSNAASVNKTMTAVAALKLLAAKNVSVTSAIGSYLPQSWTLGQGVGAITFAELLTHTSGIRDTLNPDTSYANLKATMAQNIVPANKVYTYQNANFALFRVLIRYLNGASDAGVQDLAAATDQGYLDYMNSVYAPDIKITCKPKLNPVLSYPYPPGSTHGTDWGDWTDLCGAGGLQLSVHISAKDFEQPERDDSLHDGEQRLRLGLHVADDVRNLCSEERRSGRREPVHPYSQHSLCVLSRHWIGLRWPGQFDVARHAHPQLRV